MDIKEIVKFLLNHVRRHGDGPEFDRASGYLAAINEFEQEKERETPAVAPAPVASAPATTAPLPSQAAAVKVPSPTVSK